MIELSGRPLGDGVRRRGAAGAVRDREERLGRAEPVPGLPDIADRPSSWDLTPNGSDPTGTHIDFMGLPRGKWTIKIFTVSGDLVQTLRSEDAVNESIRTAITTSGRHDGAGVQPAAGQSQRRSGELEPDLTQRTGHRQRHLPLHRRVGRAVLQRGKFVVIR